MACFLFWTVCLEKCNLHSQIFIIFVFYGSYSLRFYECFASEKVASEKVANDYRRRYRCVLLVANIPHVKAYVRNMAFKYFDLFSSKRL